MTVGWNLLYGFPGETELDYRDQATLLPHLLHLPPPRGAGRIWMERFSPIFTDRDAFPAKSVRPEASYTLVYPEEVNLDDLAYFFDYELEGTLGGEAYEETCELVGAWIEAWAGEDVPGLDMWSAPGFVQIDDTRTATGAGIHTFEDPLASIYLACSDAAREPPRT